MSLHNYDWNSKYNIGVEQIDDQHRYFLSLINKIIEESEQTDHIDYLLALINELKAYAKFHFISEENLMLKTGYPGLAEHRQHHRQLLHDLAPKITNAELKKSHDELQKLINYLLDWFFHHTAAEDRLFGDYFAKSSSPA